MTIPGKMASSQLSTRGLFKEQSDLPLRSEPAQAAIVAAHGDVLAGYKNASFQQASAPSNPAGGYTLRVADEWVSTDTTTNCADLNCTGRARNTDGSFTVALGTAAPHSQVTWHHLWNGSAWKDSERQLVASEIVAGKIAAGAITTDKLAARSITADTLTVKNHSNIWPNATSEEAPPTGADTTTPEWAGRTADATAYAGGFVRQVVVPTTGGQVALGDQMVTGGPGPFTNHPSDQSYLGINLPCTPGEQFYIEAQIRMKSYFNNTPAGVHIWFLDANKSPLANQPAGGGVFTFTTFSSPGGTTIWVRVTTTAKAPAGAVYAHCNVFVNSTTGPVTAQFDGIFLRSFIAPIPISLTPNTGWSVPVEAKYWLDDSGNVHLLGAVTYNSGLNAAFTMPTGLRPTNFRRFFGWDSTAGATVLVTIDSGGGVSINAIAGGNPIAGHTYTLDAVSYLAEF